MRSDVGGGHSSIIGVYMQYRMSILESLRCTRYDFSYMNVLEEASLVGCGLLSGLARQ